MKRFIKRQKLAVITVAYWVLLIYIVAALVWWFISLENQNQRMFLYRVQEIEKKSPDFQQQYATIENERNRKTTQYIGEGLTFLLLILVGALFVYRATKKQIRLSQQQQNFIMAVTHELKTPVAIAQLNLETLQKRKLEETQQQKLIASTLEETNRLDTLTNNILLVSQLETGKHTFNKQEINFSELVNDVLKNFAGRFPQHNIKNEIAGDIYVKGEFMLLQMLLSNLIDNALKYSDKGSPIKITLKKIKNKAALTVADEGEGIPDEEKKKVFEKFYRSGYEGIRKAKGTGLGLYLCKKIAADHNGSICITDNTPQGAIFTVKLESVFG